MGYSMQPAWLVFMLVFSVFPLLPLINCIVVIPAQMNVTTVWAITTQKQTAKLLLSFCDRWKSSDLGLQNLKSDISFLMHLQVNELFRSIFR